MLDVLYTSEFSRQEADAEEELIFAKEESEWSRNCSQIFFVVELTVQR